MKHKLLQVLLGAIGSVISIVITHLANMPAEATVGAALSAGPMAAVAFGDVFRG